MENLVWEEVDELLERLPFRHKIVVGDMLYNCFVYGGDVCIKKNEEFISSVEDFVKCLEETSLEESLTRKSYN